MKIVEYVGPKNSQNIQDGTPFLVIGFCSGEWELSKTNWYDVKYNQDAIRELHDALAVNLSVKPADYDKYFRFAQDVE